MPTLSDLRNSGDIEQDADLIMFLFRPEYYGVTQINIDGNELIDVAGKGFVGVAKNRHGKCGTELIEYVAPFTEFR
jgi:replicative DNA helicase